MKTTKKLNRKHFRHLTKKDIKNPLFKIAEFCRQWTSLEQYTNDIKSIIRANRSRDPEDLSATDISNLLFDVKLTLTNIELLYVLQHSIDNWKPNKDCPYYTLKTNARGAYISDTTIHPNKQTLLFERLTKSETKNIGKFIKRFFRLLSLRGWQRLMDDLQEDFFSEDDLSSLTIYQENSKKIHKYLKKLPECIFFIYATKAIAHIFKHHVKDFYLEKYVDKENAESSDGIAEPENPKTLPDADEEEANTPSEVAPAADDVGKPIDNGA